MVDLVSVGTALVGSVAAGVFLSVALRLREQPVSAESRNAIWLFSMWWMALSINAVVSATQDLLVAFGVVALGPFIVFEYLRVFALCIGLWGLMYYLAYVLTGKRQLLAPLAVLFALYYGAIVFVVTIGRPVAVAAERARLLYEAPIVDGVATAFLLVVPPLIAAGTYLALFARTRSASHRYRAGIVGFATLLWSAGLLAREADWLDVLPALLAFASAWSVSWAYAPPKFVAKQLAAE